MKCRSYKKLRSIDYHFIYKTYYIKAAISHFHKVGLRALHGTKGFFK